MEKIASPLKRTPLETFLCVFVLALSGGMVLFLLDQSIFLTSFENGGLEIVLGADSPLPHLGVFLALSALFALYQHKNIRFNGKILEIGCLLLFTAGLLFFILNTQFLPVHDQEGILNGAQMILEGNNYSLEEGYLAGYPNQRGFLLYAIVMVKLFGDSANVAMQIINIFWYLLAVASYSAAMANLLGTDRTKFLISSLLFIPLALYVTFVYGTLPGLALSAVGLWAFSKAIQGNRWRWYLLSAACFALAYFFKNNYLIVIVAAVLYFFWSSLMYRNWKPVVAVVLLFALILTGSKALIYLIYTRNDARQREGIPSIAWVVMGMQPDGAGLWEGMGGWYNGYNNLHCYSDDESEMPAIKERAKQDAIDLIEHYIENPGEALRFFSRKNSSQWNQSTFHSLAVNQDRQNAGNEAIPGTLRELLYSRGKLKNIYTQYCNLFLSQLWIGVLLYYIFGWRKIRLSQLFPAVVFVGGFLFHTVWEASAKYTIVYVFLMIPYAVQGFSLWGKQLAEAVSSRKLPDKGQWQSYAAAGVCILFLLGTGLSGYHFSQTYEEALACTEQDEQDARLDRQEIQEGTYYLVCGDQVLSLPADWEEGTHAEIGGGNPVVITARWAYRGRISSVRWSDYNHLYILAVWKGEEKVLGVSSFDESHFLSMRGTYSPEEDGVSDVLYFAKAENQDGYVICEMTTDHEADWEHTLTANQDGSITFQPADGSEAQVWQLIPAEG